MTYEKEVNVYNQGAVKSGIENAGKTAKKFITDDSDGIFVHPEGEGPNDTTTPTGWRIRDALELLKTGISYFKAWIDSSNIARVRVGREDSGHVNLSSTEMSFDVGDAGGIMQISYDESYDDQDQLEVSPFYTFGSRLSGTRSGSHSFVAGLDNQASAAYSAAFGWMTRATKVGQFVCGQFNKPGNFLFSVGRGQGEEDGFNSNAFTVDANGNAAVAGKMQAITGYSTTATRAMFKRSPIASVTSQSVNAGGTARVEINVADNDYTPMAIAGILLDNSKFSYYAATITGTTAVIYIKNNGSSAATTNINLVVFYIATTAL